jgi:hypothetical protein
MKNKEKPIYEEPKVFKLDEQEAVYGGFGGDSCEGGTSPDEECIQNGNNAIGYCNDGIGFGPS